MLPVIAAAAGYAFGILRAVATQMRERRKALNAVLYYLLQMRWAVLVGNPRRALVSIQGQLSQRFGPHAGKALEQLDFRDLVFKVLDSMADRSKALSEAYRNSVQELVSLEPLLADRLSSDRIMQLQADVRRYYEGVRARPEVIADPDAPPVLAKLERHTVDLAFDAAERRLGEDVRAVADTFWMRRRLQARRVLVRQDHEFSKEIIDNEMRDLLDMLIARMASST